VTGPINVGNPLEISVRDLAGKIVEMTGCQVELHDGPLPTDDPKRRQPDIALARELLAWEPKVQLKDGLKKTIEYFRALLGVPAGDIADDAAPPNRRIAEA
jgi:UDP-glucuronate decarboxylase